MSDSELNVPIDDVHAISVYLRRKVLSDLVALHDRTRAWMPRPCPVLEPPVPLADTQSFTVVCSDPPDMKERRWLRHRGR